MAEEIPKEAILELKNEMANTERRVNTLDYNASGTDRDTDARDLNWNKNIYEFRTQIQDMKKEVEKLQQDFKNNLNAVNSIISDFKDCAKRDSLDKFERKLNDMSFERMMTKQEFNRLLEDNF